MTAAVEAMGRAVAALDALKTAAALPPEMQALNALLEAQALVKKRQVSRQQSAQGGPGNNNRNYDISALFDKELQRLQETRYETRQPSGGQSRENRDALEKIAELARRQDEMLKRQQELARQRLDDAEMARQLEKLTREQAELRQQAEELARRMSKLESGQQNRPGPPTGPSSGNEQTARQLRDISNDMRSATNDLRRRDSAQSGAGGSRALEKLKIARTAAPRRPSEDQAKKPGDPRRDGSGVGTRRDAESRAMSEQRGRAQQLRQNIERRDARAREAQPGGVGQEHANGQKAPNQTGKSDERREPGPGGRGDETTRLREQAARELERTRELLDELRRQDPSFASGGTGFTFEGAGMTFSLARHRSVQAGSCAVAGAQRRGHARTGSRRIVAVEAAAGQRFVRTAGRGRQRQAAGRVSAAGGPLLQGARKSQAALTASGGWSSRCISRLSRPGG